MSSQQERDQFAEDSAGRQLDAHDLYSFIDRFISSIRNSPHVEYRWLAAYAGDLKTMAFHVKAGNHDTVKKQVNEFRLREIEIEKEKLHAAAGKLEAEEARLLRDIEQISAESGQ